MKYLYTLALACLSFATASAQTTLLPGEDGNNCSLSIEFDEVDDLTESSFTLSMNNPSTPICVLSAYFYFDDNSIRPWSYDPATKTYDVEANIYHKKNNKTGRVTDQALKAQLSDDDNPEHPGYFYVAIAGDNDFLGEEGAMATIYFDATELREGNHVLHMKDALCGAIEGEEVSKLKSTKYLCADQEIHFKIHNDVITIIDGINSIYPLPTEKRIYDLSGRATTPTQHGIYIMGGKKIMK